MLTTKKLVAIHPTTRTRVEHRRPPRSAAARQAAAQDVGLDGGDDLPAVQSSTGGMTAELVFPDWDGPVMIEDDRGPPAALPGGHGSQLG